MKVLKEFKEFINKGNVVDLAVAVVIGGAFGKIVSALVSDLVMPLVNAVIPQGDWRKWEVSPLHFRVGDFLGTLVDFTIVAFVVFIVMVKVVGAVNRKAAAPETKQCPECLETVPKAARRCRACTSVLTALALVLLAAPAFAQGNPSFTFAKPEEVKAGAPPPPPVEWKVSSGANASVEALFNLNREGSALNVNRNPGCAFTTPASSASRPDHDRVARLSVAFGFTLRYDQNPAPRPIPSGRPRAWSTPRFPAVLRQDRHAGRGDPDLHLHLSRLWRLCLRPARSPLAIRAPLLDLGKADALSLPG